VLITASDAVLKAMTIAKRESRHPGNCALPYARSPTRSALTTPWDYREAV
jgi:hypothetical protein